MMAERTVITTTESPCSPSTKKIVRWDVSSLHSFLHSDDSEIETAVDFGLFPRPESQNPYLPIKSNPDKIRLCRDDGIYHHDEYEISLLLSHMTTVRVRWSLKLSSYGGEPGVETTLVNERELAVAPYHSVDHKFRLSEIGPVGTAIATTGRIRIEAEATIVAERTDSRRTLRPPGPSLAGAIGAGLNDEELREMSDATLVSAVDGTEHPAHRLLLSMRSPVFRAAFRSHGAVGGMREARTGRVDVNASGGAVDQLLKFVYDVDDFGEDEELLLEVFDLGAFYEMPRLRGLAEVQMLETLTVQNVARRLLMATRHNSGLQDTCIEMVKENLADVMKTEGWNDIAKDACVMSSLIVDCKGKDHGKDKKESRKKRRRK